MPLYTFLNKKTLEKRDVFFHMNDEKIYKGENGDEEDWVREFTVPCASIDNSIKNPFSSKEFVDKTKNKKGTYGDLQDLSTELSHKRAELNGGEDPVKRKYFNKWSKERQGRKHPKDKKVVKRKNFEIEF